MSSNINNNCSLSHTQLSACLRVLSCDMVEQANSGHPGAPLGLADISTVLFKRFLKFDPSNPDWLNRDRFVLSNGHASALLYSLLHLTGYQLSIEDLKKFRQLGSKTPGHPEYSHTPGVEATTGPLGQGLANAVGMAIAERTLAAQFNLDGFNIIDNHTYCFMGDGDVMEGISHEASSLAGTLKLNKLIVFYDDNGISIDGKVEHWMSEDVSLRFKSYQWRVIGPIDGHDPNEISQAITQARTPCDKPTLIICKTQIGFGVPTKVGSEKIHGSPLGANDIKLLRETLQWPYPPFEIPLEYKENWDMRTVGSYAYKTWALQLQAYENNYQDKYIELIRRTQKKLPLHFEELFEQTANSVHQNAKKQATRQSSQQALEAIAPQLPELFGGSADLTSSNLTSWSGTVPLHKSLQGNYLYYGVREFSMVAILNGISLYGGFIPYGGTFLVFSDYARNAIRLSAMMNQKVIFILTHDSIGLGEDGPTHQPIEHLWSLRLIPGLSVWRPADSLETLVAWREAVKNKGPTVLALSRQSCLYLQKPNDSASTQLKAIEKGGYIVHDFKDFDGIIIATGSEVSIATQVMEILAKEEIYLRVVSLPSVNQFLGQPYNFQKEIIPEDTAKIIVLEAGVTLPWKGLFGKSICVLGIDSFGQSAPESSCYKYFKLDVLSVTIKIKEYIK
ncbi:MAG: transketolase [Methylacidiphilales bacterium]|nr:transketolase [Candidatus Methylacidiphilales bacterium]